MQLKRLPNFVAMKQTYSFNQYLQLLLSCLLLAVLPSCEAIKVSADIAKIENIGPSSLPSADWQLGGNISLAGYLTVINFGSGRYASLQEQEKRIYHFTSHHNPFESKYERRSSLGLFYEPGFIQKGGQHDNGDIRTRLNYLELPLSVAFRHYDARGGWWTIGAGPFVSYGVGGTIKNESNGQSISLPAFGNSPAYNRFDAGISAVLDYKFANGLSLGTNYDHGLANINTIARTSITTKSISLNVGYSIGRIIHLFRK